MRPRRRRAAPAPAPPGNAAAACGHAALSDRPARPQPCRHRRRPTLAFEDGNGRPVRLSAFRGRPLLVNLWATWCGPCVVEMPSLDALALRQGEAIQVLAISQDADDGRRKVADFFAARNFQRLEPYLDFAHGPDDGPAPRHPADHDPLRCQGREVWRMTGMADWSGERAARLLREADPG